MRESVPCPSCRVQLEWPESATGHNVQCPRCGSMVDPVLRGGETALTAEAPILRSRTEIAGTDCDDDLPVDLRVLIRPDPLTGQWKAIAAAIFLTANVLANAMYAYAHFETGGIDRFVVFRRVRPDDEANPQRFLRLAASAQTISFWPAVVFFFIWIHQASSNLKLLRSAGASHTPAMAVVMYFVPGLNLFRPYVIIQEIWRGSDPDAIGNSLAWLDVPSSGIIRGWWFMLVGSLALPFLSCGADMFGAWVVLGVQLSSCLAGVLLIVIITDITRRQGQRYERLYADAE